MLSSFFFPIIEHIMFEQITIMPTMRMRVTLKTRMTIWTDGCSSGVFSWIFGHDVLSKYLDAHLMFYSVFKIWLCF